MSHMMSKSRLVPWLGFGARAGRGRLLVARRSARSPTDKRGRRPTTELAVAAGVDPTRLIVDFRDDVSAETLANNGFTEIPISDYSREGPPLPHRLHDRRRGGRGAGQAVPRSQRRERRLRIVREHPARRGIARGAGRGEPGVRLDGGRVPGAAPPTARSRTTPATSTSGTCASWACRTPGSGATARASSSPSSTPASPRSATSPRPSSSPATTSSSNNDNAADDHGHGTHVAGHHRPVDQQQARRRGRRLRRRHHAAQGAERARLGLGRRHHAGDPLGGRPRRQRHQHEPGRPDADGQHGQRREVRARQGRRDRRGRRQRRARPGRLPGGLPGRRRGGGHAVRREHDVLFELGQGDRRRGAGRQHARRPERRRQARRRPATHHRPRQHVADGLPVVHGDVDGVAARGGRRGADHGRGRDASPTRSRRSCSARRASPRAAARRADAWTTTTAPASSMPARRSRRRRTASGAGELGLAGGDGAARARR